MSDQRMPGMSGVDLLREAKAIRPEATRLLFTAYADIRTVIDAINQGHVFRYLAKPWDPDELRAVVRQAVEHHDLVVEKQRLVVELQAANAKLTEANRLKGAFLEVASHELNTPVSVILGLIELCRMAPEEVPAADRPWVNRIGAAARRLARTVDRMLKLVRNGDFGRSLERQSVAVEPLLRRALDELDPYLELRGQSVVVAIDPGLGPIEVDPEKIADVLINLLANAVKFTPDGGTIRVAVAAEPGASGWLRVSVSDEGSGVPSDDQQYLFEPFFTGFDTLRHSSGDYQFGKRGLGLGLWLVKTFVEMHGGRVEVSSGEGRGSTLLVSPAYGWDGKGRIGGGSARRSAKLRRFQHGRGSIARGVPSGGDPHLPRLDQDRPVEVESLDCGAPDRCQADDFIPLIGPPEMVTPLLMTRIEQSDGLSRSRIGGGTPTSLRIVACGACQPEVVLLSGTSQDFGDEVFNLHGKACDCFLCEAVSTTIGRLSGDAVSQGLGDVRVTHRDVRNSEGSYPRCFHSATAWARISIARSCCSRRSAAI